jgi:hypothetical protein
METFEYSKRRRKDSTRNNAIRIAFLLTLFGACMAIGYFVNAATGIVLGTLVFAVAWFFGAFHPRD